MERNELQSLKGQLVALKSGAKTNLQFATPVWNLPIMDGMQIGLAVNHFYQVAGYDLRDWPFARHYPTPPLPSGTAGNPVLKFLPGETLASGLLRVIDTFLEANS